MERRVRIPLLLAAACAAAFLVLLAVAYFVGVARWADAAALQGFIGLQDGIVTPVAKRIAHVADPLPYGLLGGALVAVALARRRPRHALAAAALLGGSAVTTQVLKGALAQPRLHDFLGVAQIRAEAFPSGHGTASMALALALVLVAPVAYRPLAAAVGGFFTLAVSFSILTLGWHFPSDVVGGFLVAATWCLAAVALLRTAERPRTRLALGPRHARALAGSAAIAAAVLLVPFLPQVAAYADRHTAFAAVAAAIPVAAAAVLATVTRATTTRR